MLEFDWEHSPAFWIGSTSHAFRRALAESLGQEGITFRQWEVLAWLSANGSLSQAEMAERMNIEPHTLAGVLRRMERDGWLERRPSEHDRRKNTIVPTEKAQPVWERAINCANQLRKQALDGFSDDEAAQLRHLCQRIQTNLDNVAGDHEHAIDEPWRESKPLSLYFDISEFSDEQIADMINCLSELYKEVGGDALIIDGMRTLQVVPVGA